MLNCKKEEYFDAHGHVSARWEPPGSGGTLTAEAAGISGCICCGTRLLDWGRVGCFREAYDGVMAAYGVHPWFIEDKPGGVDEVVTELESVLRADATALIGEIGLDRSKRGEEAGIQEKYFEAQVQVAVELGRPVVMHCVHAWGQLSEVLGRFDALPPVMLHGYGGSLEMAQGLIKHHGAYISLGKLPSNPAHRQKRAKVMAGIPDEHLLAESDAHYGEPGAAESPGERLRGVIEELARVRQVEAESLRAQLNQNMRRYLAGVARSGAGN